MNNNYIEITSSIDFEKIISKMEQSIINIEKILDNETKNIESINETDIWSSKTQKVVYRKFKELDNNFSTINSSLSTYIKFLQKTVSDYKNIEMTIDTNIEKNIENLNVN